MIRTNGTIMKSWNCMHKKNWEGKWWNRRERENLFRFDLRCPKKLGEAYAQQWRWVVFWEKKSLKEDEEF